MEIVSNDYQLFSVTQAQVQESESPRLSPKGNSPTQILINKLGGLQGGKFYARTTQDYN